MSTRPLTIEFFPEPERMTTASPMLVTREERLTLLRKRKGLRLKDLVPLLAECGVETSLSAIALALEGACGRAIGKAKREEILLACETILGGTP